VRRRFALRVAFKLHDLARTQAIARPHEMAGIIGLTTRGRDRPSAPRFDRAMSHVRHRSAILFGFGILVAAGPAHALPDLVPSIDELSIDTDQQVSAGDVAEGCAGSTQGRTLVRFGVYFTNVGTDALELGDPGCPDCETNPGAICTNTHYECSPSDGHNHPHYIDFAQYELLDMQGNVLGLGGKRTFCALDDTCADGIEPFYDCGFQGISAGCDDYYHPALGCQYVDATGVPDVTRRALRLRVVFDPGRSLPDANRANDVVEYAIAGCGDGVLQAGESCDPGSSPAPPCCDGAACQLRDAGTPCRASADVCDAVETCDGAQPDCPADAAAPDGTSCGATAAACVASTCVAGACESELEPGWCMIDATCVAAGTPGPSTCALCDPARDPDAWTSTAASDRDGLGCRIDDLAALAPTACGARIVGRVERRIAKLRSRLAHQTPARFFRTTRKFARATRRFHCLEDEAASLVEQARAYAAPQAVRPRLVGTNLLIAKSDGYQGLFPGL
jgi:hypothetical protein